MRQDFRVKVDVSRLYQDARQYSWIYVDSTKIFHVNQFANHVRKIFNITEPFHLLSRYEDTCFFLPFEEDVRILENNETVVIVPGSGINTNNACIMKNYIDSSSKIQSNSIETSKFKENDASSIHSGATDKSSSQNNIQNISDIASFNASLYKTAFPETVINNTKDSQINEDNNTEEQSIIEESPMSNKRKRLRKRKQKKSIDVAPESNNFSNERSGKKPRIINSILLTSGPVGKHIRFKGLDEEDITSDAVASASENNVQQTLQNGNGKPKNNVNKDLAALLSLRQSTPLTFPHKRVKKQYNPESIQEQDMSIEEDEASNHTNTILNNNKSNKQTEKSKVQTAPDGSLLGDDAVSFKVVRMGEDYSPQLSKVIIGQILSTSEDGSQYSLKILHGKDQLKEPEGKFSLPKDGNPDDDDDDDGNDIVTLEKSQLLELTRIKPNISFK